MGYFFDMLTFEKIPHIPRCLILVHMSISYAKIRVPHSSCYNNKMNKLVKMILFLTSYSVCSSVCASPIYCLASFFPDNFSAKEVELKSSRIIERKELARSGCRAELVTLETGAKAVLKSYSKETNCSPMKEILAYEISELLELGRVPLTTLRGEQSIQEFSSASYPKIKEYPSNWEHIEESLMRAFDFLLAHNDRHSFKVNQNHLVDEESRRFVYIDHSDTLFEGDVFNAHKDSMLLSARSAKHTAGLKQFRDNLQKVPEEEWEDLLSDYFSYLKVKLIGFLKEEKFC